MTCPKCGQPYDALVCPHCAVEKSHDALRQYQIQLLPSLAEAKDEFTTHLKPDGLHVQLLGRKSYKIKNQPWRAFCGAVANAGPDKRRRLAYHAPGWQHVCEKCRAKIEELLIEAREQEAIRAQ